MTTTRLRLPERLLDLIAFSHEYARWKSGKGCLPTDRALFAVVKGAPRRADQSIHVDADPALAATVHQWALILTRTEGATLADTRANVRSGRSVIRQINPREFV